MSPGGDYGVSDWFYADGASDELNAVGQISGVPVLARPFFNAATGVEDAQLVAYPNVVEGCLSARRSAGLAFKHGNVPGSRSTAASTPANCLLSCR